jgi:hypothetical protein
MIWLAPAAFSYLLYFDLYVRRYNFYSLTQHTRKFPVRPHTSSRVSVESICAAVDRAILWYPKRVFCLQRSTVAVWLLRRQGLPAELLVGAQSFPYKAHAWVELHGQVVNDRPSVRKTFAVLERC